MQSLKLIKTGAMRQGTLKYTRPEMVFESFRRSMNRYDREHFMALHLNGKNQIIAKETISIGSLNQAIVHPREVFKGAIHNGSAAIICIHNHPTGDPAPSMEDEAITRRLRESGEILGVRVLDHIIIGDHSYHSFAEAGVIPVQCVAERVEQTAAGDTQKVKSDKGLEAVGKIVDIVRRSTFLRTIGGIVRSRRKHASMTQEAFSGATGIPKWTISRVEQGSRELSEDEARSMAGVLGLDHIDLLLSAFMSKSGGRGKRKEVEL